MINVKDNGDGSFTIDWDENDPAESILNDWTKEDFIQFFEYAAKRDFDLSKDAEKFGSKSSDSAITEATEKDYEDFWEECDSLTEELDKARQFLDKDDRLWEG